MKKRLIIVLLVSLMSSVASAAWYWNGSASNSWADANNWNDGSGSPPSTIPHGDLESMRIPAGTVTADMTDMMGYIMMGRTTTGMPAVGNVTLNLNSGATLDVNNAGSGELVSVAYTDGYTNNLNVSNGRLNVWRGNGAGELRLSHIYNSTCVGNLNLSGGIVDTEILNKGERNGGGNFYGTGGTLVIRDEIDKFAKNSELSGAGGFFLGGATLEVAPVGSAIGEDYVGAIGKIEIGNSQDTEFNMDGNSTLVLDLGDASGTAGTDWDLLTSWADFHIDGELIVRFAVDPCYNDSWDVWKIHGGDEGTYDGDGAFDTITISGSPSGTISTSWVTVTDGQDILRLTYVPEPATVILLGLGSLIAVRRRKK